MISMTISTITSRMKTKISRMEKETPVPERGTGVFLSGNQFDIEGEENEKGEIYEGVVERIDFPNKGRVHVEGETVTVKNAIPGQKIRFQINKKRKNRMEGRLLEVTEKSPMEKRDPVCSIFPSCGGCMYQTMSYEDQLAMKAGQVKKLLDDASWRPARSMRRGRPIIRSLESREVRRSLHTGIKWSFPSAMNTRTARCLSDFIKREAPTMS